MAWFYGQSFSLKINTYSPVFEGSSHIDYRLGVILSNALKGNLLSAGQGVQAPSPVSVQVLFLPGSTRGLHSSFFNSSLVQVFMHFLIKRTIKLKHKRHAWCNFVCVCLPVSLSYSIITALYVTFSPVSPLLMFFFYFSHQCLRDKFFIVILGLLLFICRFIVMLKYQSHLLLRCNYKYLSIVYTCMEGCFGLGVLLSKIKVKV